MAEPSFSNGFASPWYGGRMKYPDLWRGCVCAWAPLIGPTGAVLFDQSGLRGDSTFNGTLSTDWKVTSVGHAVSLNGSSTFLQTPFTVSSVSQLTYSIWARPTSSNLFYNMLMSCGPTLNGSPELRFQSSTGKVEIVNSNNNFGALDVAATHDGLWHHYAATCDGANFALYRDGVLRATSATSHSFPTGSTMRIGRRGDSYGGDFYLYGDIAEASVFNRLLTSQEITFLAQRPGIMLELDDSNAWGAVEAGGSVPWWAFANRQSRLIGGGVT